MRLQHVLVAGLAIVMFGCSKPVAGPTSSGKSPATVAPDSGAPAGSKATSNSKANSEPAPESEPGTPIPGPKGRIDGVVKFVGDEIPQSTIIPNGTDPQICGAEMSKLDAVISPESRGIRHVVLWLDNVELPERYKPPTSHLVIDNLKCQFEPHAAVITVGSTVQAKNSDEVYHTTHFYGDTNENPPLPEKGSLSPRYKVRRPGMMNVKCDKHGWMQAYVLVSKHPFHAVTDADGKFSIAGVPAGTYKLIVWHERFLKQQTDVSVNEDKTTTLELKYSDN